MEKLSREMIVKLSKDLMLELSEEEIENVHHESQNFLNQVNALSEIDVEGVEVMSYPFDDPTTWLREDVESHVINRELAFKNAPRVSGEYFEVVKVVK